MPTRNAHARWEGTVKEGAGRVDFGEGAYDGPYSFTSRFEEGTGTNPEELLAASHASCFSMAFSLILSEAGLSPGAIDSTAQVTVSPKEGGFQITKSHIVCEANVPGLDEDTFRKHAAAAEKACVISQALGGVEVTVEAKLAG